MAIDAVIGKVLQEIGTRNVILILVARVERDGSLSIPGQPQVTIVNATHIPAKGQAIWGGSSSAIIEPGQGIVEQKRYRRTSAGQLVEDFG